MIPGITAGGGHGTPPADTNDGSFASVVLQMSFDGTNGSAVLTEESTTAKKMAWSGAAALTNARSKFGSTSLTCGTTGSITVDNDSNDYSDWQFGSGAFTIEAWVYRGTANINHIVMQRQTTSGSTNYGWSLTILANYTVEARIYDTAVTLFSLNPADTITNGAWTHVCFERNGSGKLRLYLDGVMKASSTSMTNPARAVDFPVAIGQAPDGNGRQDGNVCDLRITKGLARYDSDSGFSVPTAHFETKGPLTNSGGRAMVGGEAGNTRNLNGDEIPHTRLVEQRV